jgi:hypothetical protein
MRADHRTNHVPGLTLLTALGTLVVVVVVVVAVGVIGPSSPGVVVGGTGDEVGVRASLRPRISVSTSAGATGS